MNQFVENNPVIVGTDPKLMSLR